MLHKYWQKINQSLLSINSIKKFIEWSSRPRDTSLTGIKPQTYVNFFDKSGIKDCIPSKLTRLSIKTIFIYWLEFAVWSTLIYTQSSTQITEIAKHVGSSHKNYLNIAYEEQEYRKQIEINNQNIKKPITQKDLKIAYKQKEYIIPRIPISQSSILQAGVMVYFLPWILRQSQQRVVTMMILKRRVILARNKYQRLLMLYQNFTDKKPLKYYHPPESTFLERRIQALLPQYYG